MFCSTLDKNRLETLWKRSELGMRNGMMYVTSEQWTRHLMELKKRRCDVICSLIVWAIILLLSNFAWKKDGHSFSSCAIWKLSIAKIGASVSEVCWSFYAKRFLVKAILGCTKTSQNLHGCCVRRLSSRRFQFSEKGSWSSEIHNYFASVKSACIIFCFPVFPKLLATF